MKLIFALILISVTLISRAQNNMTILKLDSLVNSSGKKLFDESFPNEVNQKIKKCTKNRRKDIFDRQYDLWNCYDSNGNLLKQKFIYGKQNKNNYQVLFIDYDSIYVGISYSASGTINDDKNNGNLPSVQVPLDNVFVKDKKSNYTYVFTYEYTGKNPGAFHSKEVSYLTVLILSDYQPKLILSRCNEKDTYFMFQVDPQKTVIKNSISKDELMSTPFSIWTQNTYSTSPNTLNKKYVKYPMLEWQGYIFCKS